MYFNVDVMQLYMAPIEKLSCLISQKISVRRYFLLVCRLIKQILKILIYLHFIVKCCNLFAFTCNLIPIHPIPGNSEAFLVNLSGILISPICYYLKLQRGIFKIQSSCHHHVLYYSICFCTTKNHSSPEAFMPDVVQLSMSFRAPLPCSMVTIVSKRFSVHS